MTDAYLFAHVVPAAFALLPPAMGSETASAMLLAIALQESKCQHRQQIGGPANGFWQFEKGGGVAGVLTHRATAAHARRICDTLRYEPNAFACYQAIQDNDVLACCFARLLLWTVPGPLAARDESQVGWRQYLEGWRPGKPHPQTWDAHFARAWEMVG